MVRSLESRVNAYVNMACDLSTRLFPSDMSLIKGLRVCGRVEICRKPVTGKSSSRRWPALNERHPDLTITEWFCSNTILTTFFNCNEATKIPRTKILQQIHTDWILSYHSPTPLEFFRRIQPTHRGRAFEKYQKTLRQAINVCKNSEQLKRLKELDGTSDGDKKKKDGDATTIVNDAVEDIENIDDADDTKDYGSDQQDEDASVSCVLKEINQRDQPDKRKTTLVEKDDESEDKDQEPTKRVRLESVPSSVWEFEYEMPIWLPKVMKKHETTILTTNASHELALNFWFEFFQVISFIDQFIDISEYNDTLSNADLSSLKLMFTTVLNEISWTSLEPAAERCLQALGKINNKQLQSIGEMAKEEGTHGAVVEIIRMLADFKESHRSPGLFSDDEDTAPQLNFLEEDFRHEDVGYIIELLRYACEMIQKGIPQRNNSERDIDIFVKRHVFACMDSIVDNHFGEVVSRASRERRTSAQDSCENSEGYHIDWLFTRHDLGRELPWGREFSLCERAGSRISNDKKVFLDTLRVQKTLRDMHQSLMETITAAGGRAFRKKKVLYASPKLLMPGFMSSSFSIHDLLVYIGAGIYTSVKLANFDIPESYGEIGGVVKVARIMLQTKKILRSTISRYKQMKERAAKEMFDTETTMPTGRVQEHLTPKKRRVRILLSMLFLQ
ncbi:hypothetical protein BC938DRAFT_471783 [Jimgerdemannia flammicorona]|uniref:Uncharacterized protein n=1 Tax=Jimgerdemannia flammicorona TaxID=994334 RepID=A0A433QUL0_9FUNG|nr:hypothetical protein BC938DRAFT_471783 [Jimgerdemannia flammicorona]